VIVDLFLVYQFIRRLATPFKEWDAYKLGIIDERGNVLRKRKTLKLAKERKAFGVFDVLVLNLKKLIEKVPGGQTRIASYIAALYLIREWNHFTDGSLLTEDITDEQLEESIDLFYSRYNYYNTLSENVNNKVDLDDLFEKRFFEETPAVNVGGGHIAGLGVGSQGEPGLTPPQIKRYKKKNAGPKRLRDIIGAKV
jgi:lysophospholipase L1-like esterase